MDLLNKQILSTCFSTSPNAHWAAEAVCKLEQVDLSRIYLNENQLKRIYSHIIQFADLNLRSLKINEKFENVEPKLLEKARSKVKIVVVKTATRELTRSSLFDQDGDIFQ